jgi:geranylgeranyl diphosphate/geranylgeranyl-bacteriochlorophyllide a reductase
MFDRRSMTVQVGEATLRTYLDKWDRKYWATYKVLDILQKVFYRSNPAREAFVEMCESDYVQKMTFDSYLYKTVVPGNPLDDVKLLVETVGSIVRSNALRGGRGVNVSFGSKADADRVTA